MHKDSMWHVWPIGQLVFRSELTDGNCEEFQSDWVSSYFFKSSDKSQMCVCSYLSRDIRLDQLKHTLLRVPVMTNSLCFVCFFLTEEA